MPVPSDATTAPLDFQAVFDASPDPCMLPDRELRELALVELP